MSQYILEMKNITKEFPGVKALDNVNLQVEPGEIHALIGENGAGKSTLMNVLSGTYPAGSYTGEIYYEGKLCQFKTQKDSEALGIVIIHQELALIPLLSIGENMFLGNEIRNKMGVIDWNKTYYEAERHMKQVGLNESAQTLVKDIGTGKQQLVEIAKAFSKKVKLLILDEPTSSLNDEDAKMLLDLLIAFKKEGLTSIIITHKLNEIIYCADKATIIRDGSTIETLVKGVDEFSEDRIIKGMVGRSMEDRYPKREHKVQPEISFEVKNWTVHHPLYPERIVDDNVSFHVHKGEVVGFSGLQGAGRELAMSIFGRSYGTGISGEVYLNGKKVNLRNTEDAIRHKLAYVTEDRKTNGLILGETIRFNTTLARLDKVCSGGIIDRDKEVKVAEDIKNEMGTKTPTIEQHIGNLSGGNQQKALLGKWMFTEPDVLILDEPTSSLDDREVEKLFTMMRRLKEKGVGIIFVTHFLEQVYAVCDGITVLRNGQLVGEYEIADLPRVKLVAAMMGKDFDDLASIKPESTGDKRKEPMVIEARGLSHAGTIKPFDLDIHKGEVIGLTGLLGSGRSELARAIYGADRAQTGTLKVKGKEVKVKNPIDAMHLGMGPRSPGTRPDRRPSSFQGWPGRARQRRRRA